MREQEEPMTQTMKAMEARAQWSRLLNQVYQRKARVVVEKSGIPVAAVVSMSDFERLQRLEAQRERDFEALDRTRAAFGEVPDVELEREVDKAVDEVRQELYGKPSHRRSA